MGFEINLWVWIFAVAFLLFAFFFHLIPRYNVFPYLYVLSFAVQYYKPLSLGSQVSLSKVITAILLIAYVGLKSRQNLHLKSYRLFRPLLFFSIFFIISLIWSVSPTNGNERGFSFVFLLISFWLVAHVSQEEEGLKHFIGAFVMLSIIISVSSIFGFIINPSFDSVFRTRVFGLNSNEMAQLIVLGTIPMFVSVAIGKDETWGWLKVKMYKFVIAVNIIGLFVSASRTSFVSLFLCLILLFRTASYKTRVNFIITVFITVLGILVFDLRFNIVDNFLLRIVNIGEIVTIEDVDGFLVNRISIWEEGLDIFAEHPLWGAGLTSFERQSTITKVTHNDFIWALAEGGILGFLLWLNIIILSVVITLKCLQMSLKHKLVEIEFYIRCVLFYVIAFIIHTQTANMVFDKLTWVIFGMINSLWGIIRYSSSNSITSEEDTRE